MAARSISEIEADLTAVNERIIELATGRVPLKGTVGRTEIDLTGNVDLMYRARKDLRAELKAALRRAGLIGPARRINYG